MMAEHGWRATTAATFSLLPAVIDAVPSVPVAAGGGVGTRVGRLEGIYSKERTGSDIFDRRYPSTMDSNGLDARLAPGGTAAGAVERLRRHRDCSWSSSCLRAAKCGETEALALQHDFSGREMCYECNPAREVAIPP